MTPIDVERRSLGGDPPDEGHLGVIRHMLRDLETATMAGQSFVMGKIVAVLERELRGQELPLTEQEMRVVARAVDELSSQAACVAPDVQLFRRRADLLLDLLDVARRS